MTELWKQLDAPYTDYEVSSLGKVRSNKWGKQRLLKPIARTRHNEVAPFYQDVHLYYNGQRVNVAIHRLVAQTFIPNLENKPEVNHKDGVKDRNIVDNLEWVTTTENVQHGHKTGLIPNPPKLTGFGGNHPTAKLTWEQVCGIRQATGTTKVIAKSYNVSQSLISQIRAGLIWKEA